MFSKLGEAVAAEMEKILSSDAHAGLFYQDNSEPDSDIEKSAEAKCKCKSDALQDVSYILSKVSKDLDDAGYVKSSIAAMRALEGLLSEVAGEKPEEWEFGRYSDPMEFGGAAGSDLGELSELLEPQMDTGEIGRNVLVERLEKAIEDIEEGSLDEADEEVDAISDVWEEEDEDLEPPKPPTVEEIKAEKELESANKELDEWLQKNASAGVVHRVDKQDPDLELSLDLQDLLASDDDGVDTSLIDAYLAELDSTFEDEE